MFEWILEADIYRLEKALREEPASRRPAIEQALRDKQERLANHARVRARHG
jgi:hypothetical protein